MGRKQTIIIYPHLNDCGGELSKNWYVEYSWRIPGDLTKYKERVYKGLQLLTSEERYKKAKEIIKEKTRWLKSGDYLFATEERKVYEDELIYRQEAKLYGKLKENTNNIRKNINDYLQSIKEQKTEVTYQNYLSKMRGFSAWLTVNKLAGLKPEFITRQNIIDFLTHLQNNEKYSKVTIKEYKQNIYNFFEYEIDTKKVIINPVRKIPRLGQSKDESAAPFSRSELVMLKERISKQEPWLWLSCLIQYYCAIRPGMELRSLQIEWIDFDRKVFRIPCQNAKNRSSEIVEIPDLLFEIMIDSYKLNTYPRNFYIFGKGLKYNNMMNKRVLKKQKTEN